MAAATNKAASKIRKIRESGATAQEISNTLVEKLKNMSEEIVGKATVPRRRNWKHMRYSNEERAALGRYIDANKEWALVLLRQGKASNYFKVKKQEHISRKAKTLYCIEMDNQKRMKRDKRLSQLKKKLAKIIH